MKKKISITLNEKTLKDIDNLIDHIYIRNRSQAIELLVNNALGDNKIAVILAGGPEEDIRISEKEFRITISYDNKTLIEDVIAKLKENGFKKIYLIARQKVLNSVFSVIKNGLSYGVEIQYVEEKESSGSFESLKLIRGKINSNFLVLYGDIIFKDLNIDDFWSEHIKRKGMTTLLLSTTPDPSKKGIVKIEGSKVSEFIQKPKISDVYLGFSSMFITQPELLESVGNSLEEDVFPELAKKGMLNGYISTTKIKKIRSLEDIKNET